MAGLPPLAPSHLTPSCISPTAPTAPPSSFQPLSRRSFFPQTHLSFIHFTCSVGLQPARSHAGLLHRSPPCVSFCFITNQIPLQYLPLGSDLQAGKKQIDLVNKPDKFSAPNRTDPSVRRSLLFGCSVENVTTEREARAPRLSASADRSRSSRLSSHMAARGEHKYIYFNSKSHGNVTGDATGKQNAPKENGRVGRAGRRE